MIGLDTNVLLRVLVDDGSPDVAKARDFVAALASDGYDFYIDSVVLAETVWVLKTTFGYARADIASVIEALLANSAYVVDRREAVASALISYRTTKADFSDCLIVANHLLAGCSKTASLDKTRRQLKTVIPL